MKSKILLSLLLFSLCGCQYLNLRSGSYNSGSSNINSTPVSSNSNSSINSSLNNEVVSSTSQSNSVVSSSTSQSNNVVSSSTSQSNNVVSSSTSQSNSISSSIISSLPISSSTNNSSMQSSSSNITKPTEMLIDIYSTNDFHGRISENSSLYEPGIAKLATYLDNRKAENPNGYIYINSGDYWQDTYESGYNKGALLTECLDLMECEGLALGNHEFDWGTDVIRDNLQYTSYTKFLGANVRKYPNTNESVDFAEPYKIIERNGLKIGLIGAIGQDQITSITSSNWEDITFLPHVNVVQNLSDELRNDKDCDIVILSIHADESVSGGNELTRVSPNTNKKYVDAVFCAHTHQREVVYYNDVPFVQAGDHGRNLGHVQLQYKDGKVTAKVAEIEGYKLMNSLKADVEIQQVIDRYFTDDFIAQKNKVHGTINGTINSQRIGNVLAKATYELLDEKNIDVDVVINNGTRDEVASGSMTSEKIFNLIPFTNKTLVVKNIQGKDIINECVNYGYPYYMPDTSLKIESNKYYTVACIDYLMLHKNSSRNYNYFSSYKPANLIYTIEEYSNTIVEKYLQKYGTINTNDYIGTNYNCMG